MLLGGGAKNVLQRVVAWGDGWLPTGAITPERVREGRATLDALAKEAGRDPKGISISVHGQSGDRELIEYACYNLLTNAVKYSPQRTTVTVSAWKDAGQIRVAVRDQGIGIDQKEVKQIFQKFYRTKKAEESGEAGTGIGLSIVQQIVEQHGGEIEVTSQPGAGSCFTLTLPAAPPPPAPLLEVAEQH